MGHPLFAALPTLPERVQRSAIFLEEEFFYTQRSRNRRMLLRRLLSPGVTVLVLWLAGTPWTLSGSSRSKAPPGVDPEERILVGPLGYRPPGALYMLSGKVFSSLDFIDAHHLLFTFHQPRLLQREANPGRSENDQVIRAVVISLPSGEVQASSEWRMHDRSRYLWPVGGGKFLVRQRSAYLLTDASLKLSPYIDVATPVLETEVSPDGRILVIEHEYERHTAEQHSKLEAEALQYGEPPPSEDTQITLLNTASREVLGALHTELPIKVPITSAGYVGVKRDQGDAFLVRFMPFVGESVLLGKVASTCTPHETFLNQKALVIESCGPKSTDTFLDVWTTDGKKLWSGRRDGHQVWPTYAYATSGDRFAEGLLQVSHTIDLADSLNDEDVRAQVVQVFDVATGALLMATNASPILTAGQNFALSGDGERLAVLREGAIEIYKVPAPPAVESTPPAAKKK
jgi:hypothetical protein